MMRSCLFGGGLGLLLSSTIGRGGVTKEDTLLTAEDARARALASSNDLDMLYEGRDLGREFERHLHTLTRWDEYTAGYDVGPIRCRGYVGV